MERDKDLNLSVWSSKMGRSEVGQSYQEHTGFRENAFQLENVGVGFKNDQ